MLGELSDFLLAVGKFLSWQSNLASDPLSLKSIINTGVIWDFVVITSKYRIVDTWGGWSEMLQWELVCSLSGLSVGNTFLVAAR